MTEIAFNHLPWLLANYKDDNIPMEFEKACNITEHPDIKNKFLTYSKGRELMGIKTKLTDSYIYLCELITPNSLKIIDRSDFYMTWDLYSELDGDHLVEDVSNFNNFCDDCEKFISSIDLSI